ncbi:MAG: oligoketide cyclase [Aphanocapsa feldmannii 277cV]|uniref:Oligoketide cyclase n=2 Tax=Aphanocapsa feldmannii TaxID=192050 RepID=A0A524RKW2_9CHRO|nr:MAG: oligoketide cyclase [Aphanocapsa feldmannii 288cV]TGG90521.1 MAG: oligoketide cyclase [Aphanocapsa feldmannii 277cV]TGH23999.1 MAG: oligoketide cyclase [Aphanocapsa feldmannii 277cI]
MRSPTLFNPFAASQYIQQEMERLPQGVRRLAARLHSRHSLAQLWSVLTDYTALSRFIPNLASSRLLWRQGNRVGLEQVGSQQFCGLRFSARVELELVEEPDDNRLRFSMLRGDFRRFEGAWLLEPAPEDGSCWLRYELTVQGKAGMPIGLVESRLREDLASNLTSVELETEARRQA